MLALSQYNRYLSIVNNGIARSDLLTEREDAFITGLHSKFQQYRRSTYISDKQDEWLESIEHKLREEMGSTYED